MKPLYSENNTALACSRVYASFLYIFLCFSCGENPERKNVFGIDHKALDKRTHKSTEIFDLHSTLFHVTNRVPWLAMTCVDFGWVQIHVQFNARFSAFGHPTQVNTSLLQVNFLCLKFTTFCNLHELASRLANPFGRPLQVHTQVLVLQTCIDLWFHLARDQR